MKKIRSCSLKIVWLMIMLLPLVLYAQSDSKPTKAQKKTEKKKQQRIQEERKADLEGKKFHYKIQDKATRKRMKKHRRKVDHADPYNRPGFFKRLFGKKQSNN